MNHSRNALQERFNSYIFENNRRATFKTWVFSSDNPCNADKMAEAGFIYTGKKKSDDDVECFFCGKSLNEWSPEDDPWKEHLKHASYCKFAQLQKTQKKATVREILELKKEFMVVSLKKIHESRKKNLLLASGILLE